MRFSVTLHRILAHAALMRSGTLLKKKDEEEDDMDNRCGDGFQFPGPALYAIGVYRADGEDEARTVRREREQGSLSGIDAHCTRSLNGALVVATGGDEELDVYSSL